MTLLLPLLQGVSAAYQAAGVDPAKPYLAVHLRLHGMVRERITQAWQEGRPGICKPAITSAMAIAGAC